MFPIVLSVCTDDNNKVTKTMTASTTLNGTLRGESSIVNPVVLVEGNTFGYNYAYIAQFNRYYYVVDMISIRENLTELHLHCDVLMTYGSGIRSLTGLVIRQENDYNLFLSDPLIRTYANPHVLTRAFPGGFSSNQERFVLLVLGSGGTNPNPEP